MKLRIAATLAGPLIAVALLGVPVPAATPLMNVDEIRPGMVGVGRTVLEGTELKDFKVLIIGVLRNVQGPKRDLILARLDDPSIAESGVAQGMSGSPVFINGRLIGAVSYSIGAFPKVILAEGDYSVVARNEGKVYNGKFKVEPGFDREIEVLSR